MSFSFFFIILNKLFFKKQPRKSIPITIQVKINFETNQSRFISYPLLFFMPSLVTNQLKLQQLTLKIKVFLSFCYLFETQ
jgi:hypothetical protein